MNLRKLLGRKTINNSTATTSQNTTTKSHCFEDITFFLVFWHLDIESFKFFKNSSAENMVELKTWHHLIETGQASSPQLALDGQTRIVECKWGNFINDCCRWIWIAIWRCKKVEAKLAGLRSRLLWQSKYCSSQTCFLKTVWHLSLPCYLDFWHLRFPYFWQIDGEGRRWRR